MPQRRGAEVFAYQLSTKLIHQGHRVFTAYLYPWSGPGAVPLGPADRVLAGNSGHWLETSAGLHPLLLRKVLDTIDSVAPDIVQVNGARTVKYGAFARQLRQREHWALVHRNIGEPAKWIRGRRRRLLYEFAMRRADGLVAVSRSVLQQMEHLYSRLPSRSVIPTGIELDAICPTRQKEDVRRENRTPREAHVVLFAGSLSAEKRPDHLLRVFDDVRRKVADAFLWFAGDGPLRGDLERQADEQGIAPVVRFLGNREDIGSVMAAADVLALLSSTEGLPAVLIEAGALGIPVVATRVGGVPECVLDAKTGILVDVADGDAASSAIVRLLTNRSLRNQIGGNARAFVQSAFDLSSVAAAYVQFYQDVLAVRRSRSDGHEQVLLPDPSSEPGRSPSAQNVFA